MVLSLVREGRTVADLAGELEVSESTIHRWKSQDLIDRGARPGTAASEGAELRAARRRIAELEAELAATKRAWELFDQGRVVPPKELFSIVARLGAEGHGLKFCCGLLGVAPSGFFRWRSEPPSAGDIGRAWLGDLVVRVWEASRRTYGKRRIRAELEDACGEVVNMKLVTRVMREHGISALPRRRRHKPSGSNSVHGQRLGEPGLRPRPAEPAVDDRHHRAPHSRGQALLLCRARCVLPPGRRLVRRPKSHNRHGQHRARDGDQPPRNDNGDPEPHRPRPPIHVVDVLPQGPLRWARPVDQNRRRRL